MPWNYSKHAEFGCCLNGKLVAMVYVRRYDGAPNAITTIPDEEGLANKHLILTSGRLYHALAKITDEAQFGDRISDESIIEALAAMKEARGE